MQIIWEYLGDPDPRARTEAAGRARRVGWALVLVATVLVGIAPVMAFGIWGLLYPGLVLALGGGLVELYAWSVRLVYPDQRIAYDGQMLHFEGTHPLFGQSGEPQALHQVRQFAVYPTVPGYEPSYAGSPTRGIPVSYNILHLWLDDGTQRCFAFRPRGHGWRKHQGPHDVQATRGIHIAAALGTLLPEHWRDPLKPMRSCIDMAIDKRNYASWGRMPPPASLDGRIVERGPVSSGLSPAKRFVLIMLAMLVILVLGVLRVVLK